jgi:hypothetical protein
MLRLDPAAFVVLPRSGGPTELVFTPANELTAAAEMEKRSGAGQIDESPRYCNRKATIWNDEPEEDAESNTNTELELQHFHCGVSWLGKTRIERMNELLHLRSAGCMNEAGASTSEWAWLKLVEVDAVLTTPMLPFSHHELGIVSPLSSRCIRGLRAIAKDADSLQNLCAQIQVCAKIRYRRELKASTSLTAAPRRASTRSTNHPLRRHPPEVALVLTPAPEHEVPPVRVRVWVAFGFGLRSVLS